VDNRLGRCARGTVFVVDVDLDWYLDNVVVPSGPEYAPVGTARRAEAKWLARQRELLALDEPALRPAIELALRQGFVLTRGQALECGLSDADLRRLLRRHVWTRPRPGVVAPLALPGDPVLAATAAARLRPCEVISCASAATVQGLPLLGPVGPPALTSPHVHQANSRDDIRVHVARLDRDEEELWFGARVTRVERTVVDLARARGIGQGLVAADAALHEQLTTPRRLRRAVERQRGWPGVRAARAAVELADGRSESPGESLARLELIRHGLPIPKLQVWVDTSGGRYRVDIAYERERVLIEVDGLLKYRADPQALIREKRRQEYLERAGYRVVRVTWDELVRRPPEFAARVRAALAAPRVMAA
jgi:very-short-patch-repair endonuclease